MPLLDAYGRPLVGEEVAEERRDAWANQATGLGVWGLDKTKAASYLPPWRVLDQELTNLYNGSDVAKKIVGKRPEEMFRRGFEIEADNVEASKCDDVREYASEYLDLETNMREGMRWSRLYGGGLLCMGLDDGRHPWEPLDEKNIRSFDSLSFVDRRYAYVQSQYANVVGSQAKYGQAEIYLISNAVAGYGWNSYGAGKIRKVPAHELEERGAMVSLWHESRLIRFDGNPADIVTKQNLAGWSWSVIQVVYEAMRQFDGAFDSAGYLLSDASQGVLKLQGLFKAITAGQRGALASRALLLEQTRSVLRSIVLDKEEDFTRIATPFGGIPELLDRMMLRLSSAADMPATELFGRAPAGMNATGESDTRKWYDTIEAEQKNDLGPRLKRILKLLALAKDGPLGGKKPVKWQIKFHPLWSPTDQELAQTRLANAQRDQIYIANGVVKPEEVAVDLFDTYPNLDVDAREDVLKAGVKFDPYENEPAPQGPAIVGKSAGQEPLSSQTPAPLMGTTGTQVTPGTQPVVAAAAGAQGKGAPPAGKPAAGQPVGKAVAKAAPGAKPAPGKPGAKPPAGKGAPAEKAAGEKGDGGHASEDAATAGALETVVGEGGDGDGDEDDLPWHPLPRGEQGKFGHVERQEIVHTAHGPAHVQLAVASNGEHRFSARARKPDGKPTKPLEVRLSGEHLHPDVLASEAMAKRRMALSLSLPAHTRAQALALSEALDAHGLRLRRQDGWTGDFDEGKIIRVPAGQPGGGEFAGSEGGGGGGSAGGGGRTRDLSEKGKAWLAKAEAEGKLETSWSTQAKAWLANASNGARSFFTDKAARAETFKGMAHAIRNIPHQVAHMAIEKVQKTVKDAKLTAAGINRNLHGEKMSPEQKAATKRIAVKLALAVAAHYVAAAAPLHFIASEGGRKIAEQIADHLAEHSLERAAKRGFKAAAIEIELDAADANELELLVKTMSAAMADELEEMARSGDISELIERLASGRSGVQTDHVDWNENQERDEHGRFGSGGGGGGDAKTGALFSKKEISSLPERANQPTRDRDKLFEQAKQAHEQQLDLLDRGTGLDKDLGAQLARGDQGQKADYSKPGPVVVIGPMKKPERSEGKVEHEYHGDWSQLRDVVRGSVAVDSFHEIPHVLESLKARGMTLAQQPKDRFAKPLETGYRDMLLNVKYPNGHVGELQIHVKPMLEAKQAGHKLYEQSREFEPALASRTMSRDSWHQYDRLVRQQRRIYDPAWAKATAKSDAGDWDEAKHPRGPDGKFGEGGGEASGSARAHELAHEALQGGFTYRPGASAPTDGYIVSLAPSAGYNHVIELKDLASHAKSEKEIESAVASQVHASLEKALPYLAAHPDTYFGGWLETEKGTGAKIAVHLDVNEHHQEVDKATAAGRSRNQLEIWDVKNMKGIATGGTGRGDGGDDGPKGKARGDAGAGWDEEKHPRGPDGKFGEGGGASVTIRESEGITTEAGYAHIQSLKREGHVYRGMTAQEYENTVGAGKGVHSTGAYSATGEGTNFSDSPEDGEGYANHGRDDPRQTGRSTYLVEAKRGGDMKAARDGYIKSASGTSQDQVARVWEMHKNESGGVSMREIPVRRAAADAGGDWDEAKHPRGPDGKFGEGGGAAPKATANVPVKQLIESLPKAAPSAPGGEDPLMGASSDEAFWVRSRERTEGAEPSSVAAVRDFTAGRGYWRDVRAYEKDPEGWSRAHPNEAADVKQTAHNIAQFFREAQPTPGLVYRGMAADDAHVRALLEHDTLTMPATSSTARDAGIAMSFVKMGLYDRPGDHPVVLRLRERSGVAIEHISNQGEGEREVLLPKGTSFRITGRSQAVGRDLRGEPHLIIDAEEISR